MHHTGTDAELDALRCATSSDRARGARTCSASIRAFEGNTYTFIADYLPWAQRRRHGASQQHHPHLPVVRFARTGSDLLDTIAHEFFHAWNVERIRPKSLEPFNFEEANMSGELWLAEGFTSYYGPLIAEARRADNLRSFLREIGRAPIEKITTSPPARSDRRSR